MAFDYVYGSAAEDIPADAFSAYTAIPSESGITPADIASPVPYVESDTAGKINQFFQGFSNVARGVSDVLRTVGYSPRPYPPYGYSGPSVPAGYGTYNWPYRGQGSVGATGYGYSYGATSPYGYTYGAGSSQGLLLIGAAIVVLALIAKKRG